MPQKTHRPSALDRPSHTKAGIPFRKRKLGVPLQHRWPIGGTRYEQERLRCGTCGKVQSAELPEEAGPAKCDPSVPAIIATLHYSSGNWQAPPRVGKIAGKWVGLNPAGCVQRVPT